MLLRCSRETSSCLPLGHCDLFYVLFMRIIYDISAGTMNSTDEGPLELPQTQDIFLPFMAKKIILASLEAV